MEKLILTDVDGVLLNWDKSFDKWMKEKKYKKHNNNFDNVAQRYKIKKEESRELVKTFNESSEIGFLEPFRDSVEYIKKLYKKGYKFHCITSLGRSLYSQKLRKINLENLFGSCFSKFIFLDVSERKNKILNSYKNSDLFWIEDKFENALDGLNVGLKPILMKHDYSNQIKHNKIMMVNSWKEIYEIIT
jgi:phosphoglycolate phosphatase-like HAD superfamily hydrolase